MRSDKNIDKESLENAYRLFDSGDGGVNIGYEFVKSSASGVGCIS